MSSKHKELGHARSTFAKMMKDVEDYFVTVSGKKVSVMPGVFSPKYFSDVGWFVREVPKVVGERSFLEIGTGTGVVALFVALHGATKVLATDINPAAVRNARGTFRSHDLRIPVRLGDVCKPIRPSEKFDVIFWNHPFHFSATKPQSMLERGGYDHQYESLRKFFAEAKKYLTPGGEVLLGTSKNARLDLIRKFAREYGYSCRLLKQESISSHRRRRVRIDVRIYSFRPKI